MTQAQKHTPGKWKSGGCVVWQDDGDQICDLSMSMRKPDETEANARLIAAAPELLEACKAALEHVCDTDACSAKRKLEAAIAKAEASNG